MQISTYFSVAEGLHTTRKEFAAKQKAYLTVERALNMSALGHQVLDPLRFMVETPVIISSWLRCPELNAAVGGSPTTQHVDGTAADLTVKDTVLWGPFRLLGGMNIGQRILYLSAEDKTLWIHVSIPKPDWKFNPVTRCWDSPDGSSRPRTQICYPHKKFYMPAWEHPRFVKDFHTPEEARLAA